MLILSQSQEWGPGRSAPIGQAWSPSLEQRRRGQPKRTTSGGSGRAPQNRGIGAHRRDEDRLTAWTPCFTPRDSAARAQHADQLVPQPPREEGLLLLLSLGGQVTSRGHRVELWPGAGPRARSPSVLTPLTSPGQPAQGPPTPPDAERCPKIIKPPSTTWAGDPGHKGH